VGGGYKRTATSTFSSYPTKNERRLQTDQPHTHLGLPLVDLGPPLGFLLPEPLSLGERGIALRAQRAHLLVCLGAALSRLVLIRAELATIDRVEMAVVPERGRKWDAPR
jgi:hypothetical protein